MPSNEMRGGLSLEYKLPLLITALLVATMAVGTLVAYLEVKSSTVETVRTRLEFLARDLANVLEPAVPQRTNLFREVTEDPVMRAYLAEPDESLEDEIDEALGRLHLNNQADLRLFLMDADREPVYGLYPDAPAYDVPLPVTRLDPVGFGPLFEFNEGVYFWTSLPVLAGRDTMGFVAELRRVGGTGAVNPFEALIGQDAQVYFGNASGGGTWVSLDGEPYPPPTSAFTGPAEYDSAEGESFFAHAVTVPGMQWQVVAQTSREFALARPRAFLRHAGLTSLLMGLLGMGLAWVLSRRITGPLAALRLASEAIAHGDYDRRVVLHRADEMGILARAYNHMADRVKTAHQELTAQYTTAQELASELDRASRAKSEFLATMSHEIRTPINAIVGYTDLLLLGVEGPVNEAQTAQLNRIRVSGRHLVNLVDQVLDLARVESGRLQVEIETAPASASVETMLTVLGPQAEAKKVRVIDECPEDESLWYEGDPQRVDQILVNLLSNAIKFTDPGGVVTIRCMRESEQLPFDGRWGIWTCLSIEDSGLGIEPEHLETIFEPFVQIETGYTRRHGGAGLGLSISLRLARSMGGDLTVISEPGDGSTFTLWLPAAAVGEVIEGGRVSAQHATRELA